MRKRNKKSFSLFFFIKINMKKILLFVVSISCMTHGLIYMFLYINLFSFGYTIGEYLEFIFTSLECDLFWIGFLLYFWLIIRRK